MRRDLIFVIVWESIVSVAYIVTMIVMGDIVRAGSVISYASLFFLSFYRRNAEPVVALAILIASCTGAIWALLLTHKFSYALLFMFSVSGWLIIGDDIPVEKRSALRAFIVEIFVLFWMPYWLLVF